MKWFTAYGLIATIFDQDLGDGITSRLGSILSYYWAIFLVDIRYITTILASCSSKNPVKICRGATSSWQCCTALEMVATMLQTIILHLNFMMQAISVSGFETERTLRCLER
jgi:hypothetical protein